MSDTPGPVLAAHAWPTNGHLIADVARLGYLRPTDRVLDPTYGNGVWWSIWRPHHLTPHVRAQDGTDFRNLPYDDHTFDAIAYDPPYVCPGGRKTSTVQNMHHRYGMDEGGNADPDFTTPAELQALIDDGLTEMVRLVRPPRTKTDGGIILVKCQDYIWSGALWEGVARTRQHALDLGCTVVDTLIHLGKPGPQPTTNPDGTPRRQVHARRAHSTLLVLRAPKAASAQAALDLGGAA